MVRELFKLGYKQGLIPKSGENEIENEYASAKRSHTFKKYGFTTLGFAGLCYMNLSYLVPKFSVVGRVNFVLANCLYYFTISECIEILLRKSFKREFLAECKLADIHKEFLLDCHKENKLLFRYENDAVFPPNPLSIHEKYYTLTKEVSKQVQEKHEVEKYIKGIQIPFESDK